MSKTCWNSWFLREKSWWGGLYPYKNGILQNHQVTATESCFPLPFSPLQRINYHWFSVFTKCSSWDHWSFSSGDLPSNVRKNDLRAERSQVEGHQMIGEAWLDGNAAADEERQWCFHVKVIWFIWKETSAFGGLYGILWKWWRFALLQISLESLRTLRWRNVNCDLLETWGEALELPPCRSNTYPIAQDSFHFLPPQAVSDYLSYLFEKSSSAQQRVENAVKKTKLILQPLVQALKMEGYHYLQPPCNSDYPTNPTCQYPKPLELEKGWCFLAAKIKKPNAESTGVDAANFWISIDNIW